MAAMTRYAETLRDPLVVLRNVNVARGILRKPGLATKALRTSPLRAAPVWACALVALVESWRLSSLERAAVRRAQRLARCRNWLQVVELEQRTLSTRMTHGEWVRIYWQLVAQVRAARAAWLRARRAIRPKHTGRITELT